jgi:hypothetical protein
MHWKWLDDPKIAILDPDILIQDNKQMYKCIHDLSSTLEQLKEMIVGQQMQTKNMLIYNSALEMESIIDTVINKWKNGGLNV